MRRRRGNNCTHGIEPVGPRDQRLLRLECQRAEVPIAGGDIGRVGDDQLEARRAQGVKPATVAPVDIQPERGAVALRNDQRGSARIDGADLGLAALML